MTTDLGWDIPPADVCLVLMPYAAVERPSIALSILKASLARAGVSATVVYGNILFAGEIGVHAHDIIGKTQSHSLAGEWTFAAAAFPDYEPDNDAYFEHIGPGLRGLLPLVRQRGGRGQMRNILETVRRRTPEFIDRLARRILDAGPRVVGCSSTFQQHCASLALLRRVKELDPGVVTVIGGANCEASMGVATHRECPWVDYVVSGEADEVFPALCEQILDRRPAGRYRVGTPLTLLDQSPEHDPLDGAIGPTHRAAEYEAIRARPPRARVEDMSRSPAPDYDDYFRVLREAPAGLYIKPGLLIETSRGCWWGEVSHCTFCGLNGTNMGFRSKPPVQVVDEFRSLSARYDTRTFEVVDNILDMKFFKTVLPALEAGQHGFDIFFETKANLSRNHLRQLAAAGVRWIQPGIESLDDGILALIAKGTTARQNLQLLKWSQEFGVYVLWILLYDVPGDNDAAYQKMAEWLPLVAHLQPPSGLSFIQYNRFSPYHTRPADFGLRLSPDRSYGYVYPWEPRSLEEFAYFFDDYTIERDHVSVGGPAPRRPGLRAIHRAVAEWQTQWLGLMNGSARPTEPVRLVMRRDGERIVIDDARDCRVRSEFVLEGPAVPVYEACDQFRTPESLLRELAARTGRAVGWDEVAPILADLCANKLVLHLDGYYFSLATAGRLAPMSILHYPGGRLRTQLEAEAAELVRHAEGQLAGVADYAG